ncbi:NAD(P)-dependent oxidoreductase [Micromonospora sp. NPDC049523]|uniref:SDR family oxidoreductase n=1 Tax=Micromonospora sp. NPDC049523 TaxID=3155921 RepID=UPI00342FF1DD
MRVLVTGAGGMLGSAVVPQFREAGHQVVASDIKSGWTPLDVTDPAAFRRTVESVAPDAIMHLAARTSLEDCERDPASAAEVNAAGTRIAAELAGANDIPIVYVSTAGVFDGANPMPYEETDPANPVNVYGRTKLLGEEHIIRRCTKFFILRAGWMIGGGALDHKFVGQLCRQLADGRRTLHAVGDKFGSPTYTVDFAHCMLALLATDGYGLYHATCQGSPSRYEVAAHLLDRLGLRRHVSLVKVDSDHFAGSYPAPRPRSEAMRNRKLELAGIDVMRPWRDALGHYLDQRFGQLRSIAAGADPADPTIHHERHAVI